MSQLKKKSPVKTSVGKQKRKSREELNAEGRERKRQKKQRGNQAGSRHQDNSNQKKQSGTKQERDPRIGSKASVPLIIGEKAVVKKTIVKKPVAEKFKATSKPRLSPQEELEMLENDERLDSLLARLEQGEKLSQEENDYVDNMLDRIDTLMEQLGIALEDDGSEEEQQDDIMQLLKGK
ncbi:Der GTPase-activating protein YihI [Xenorhabdus indica]|uniref:Der GTPase-activating protein YihI n=1 Tax=Xenorhabdus indica TaxID=333964 RepID=UPI001657083C|nr:Der GTPase-activating protein YihI [Xenorhabdus indica]MBC8946445.1 GTPase-activating protein [Xenorhabdus indica]